MERIGRCEHCGASLEAGWAFCNGCGSPIEDGHAATAPRIVETTTSLPPWVLVIGGIVLVLVLGAALGIRERFMPSSTRSHAAAQSAKPTTVTDEPGSTDDPANVLAPTHEPCVSGGIDVSPVTFTGGGGSWALTANVTNRTDKEIKVHTLFAEIALSDFPDHFDEGTDLDPPTIPYYIKPGESVEVRGSYLHYQDQAQIVAVRWRQSLDDWDPADFALQRCGSF